MALTCKHALENITKFSEHKGRLIMAIQSHKWGNLLRFSCRLSPKKRLEIVETFCGLDNAEMCLEYAEMCLDNVEVCLDNVEVCLDNAEVCLDNVEVCLDNAEVCLDNEEVCLDLIAFRFVTDWS